MKSNYEKYKESIKKATRKYLGEHQELRLLGSLKANAKKKNIEVTISVDDITIPKYCPLLGIPLTNILGNGRVQTNASIDRIDSSKGYTPDNIQVISDLANRMKQEATPDQLITFARNIIKIYS